MLTKITTGIWDMTPSSTTSQIEESGPHRRLQKWVAYNEDLTELTIRPTEDYEFTMLVPSRLEPWWREYDRSEPHSCHEPITTRTFIEDVDRGDVVWDIGSQWGYFGVLAADLTGSPGDVHVFDMNPYHCLQMRRTSDKLYGTDGLNVVEARIDDEDGPGAIAPDTYATDEGDPDFVKVDIEGAEVNCVVGMERTIESSHPTLVIEVHPNKIVRDFDRSEAAMLEYLRDEYDTVKFCSNYRDLDSEWEPLESPDEQIDRTRGLDGNYDLDSYQIYCR